MVINHVLSIKDFVLKVHVTLVKPSINIGEHNNPTKSSEPWKHLQNNTNHCFTWTIISNVSKNPMART